MSLSLVLRSRAARWAVVIVVGGVAAGLFAAAMTLMLHAVQGWAFGAHTGTISGDVGRATLWRRLAVPVVGGIVAGLAWWALRRRGPVISVDSALTTGRRMGFWRPVADSFTQILVVATGAPIGREAAPRQASSAATEQISRWVGMSDADAKLALACAAGAGLSAVYNVPIAGVVFTLELLLHRLSVKSVAGAGAMCVVSMLVARPVVGSGSIYRFPDVEFSWVYVLFAALAVPVCAAIAVVFQACVQACKKFRPGPSWRLPAAIAVASVVAAGLAYPFPQIAGNGMDIVQDGYSAVVAGVEAVAGAGAGPGPGAGTVIGVEAVWLFLGLAVAKLVATSIVLGAGADGGVLTPSLAVGAAVGAAIAIACGLPAAPITLIFGAAVLGIVQNGWIFGAVMAWELAAAPLWIIPLALVASGGAYALAGLWSRRKSVE
ncbi:H+/Cl- antiporter ClcA [Arcanobacterium wilhelmae]|uniref:H+/Cl- antiporter ClcA n=1 Tax=Arcanobacterium wilhelmae TaxID=1803177 RepID=A0ABT9NB72_9ACTO|nr:chloride channel protein [Arcanobacterium wilhelmae]MDP9800778.1 H+/Cl- antiporter ClcA [Arcanobacterium wilhelmae]WFN90157.1 chloride channel protein [Arcanobacterium wilhelmae]